MEYTYSDPSDYTDEQALEIVVSQNQTDGKTSTSTSNSTPEKKSPTTSAKDSLERLMQRIRSGTMPELFKLGPATNGLEIGAGLVCVIGAPPGAGKTTLAMQMMFEALGNDPKLRAVVANRESSIEVLLQRELARRSGVNSKAIRFGKCSERELSV